MQKLLSTSSLFRRLMSAGLAAAAVLCFLLALYIGIRCRPWAWIIYAENPYAHLLAGLGFLYGAWWFHAGHRLPWRARLRPLGRGLLLVTSAALAFACAEGFLRAALLRHQQEQSIDRLKQLRETGRQLPIRSSHPMAFIIEPVNDDRLVYTLKPNLRTEFGRKILRTNAGGLRSDREFEPGRQPGVVRILGLGDSGMFGWNVDQGEEYPAVLQTLLDHRPAPPRYEVLNLAVPGYNTQLEVERLRQQGLAFAPDIVVVGWCENDYQLPFFMLQKENFRRRDLSFFHLLLFDRPRLADVVAGVRIEDHRTYHPDQVTEELRAGCGKDGVRQAFKDLRELADSNGFHALLFGPLKKTELALAEEAGLPCYNTLKEIPAGTYPEEWSVHFMHPRPEGHRVLAEKLAAELDRRGWLDDPGTQPHG